MKLLSVLTLLCGLAAGGFAAPVELLTAEEAAKPNLPTAKEGRQAESLPLVQSERGTPAAGAPQILVDTPTPGVGVSTPFPVRIRFVPSAGARIDVGSLKVDVLKLVPISLVSRIRPYLSASGINVPDAKIPAGTYSIRIAVADDMGREGSTVQTWTVH